MRLLLTPMIAFDPVTALSLVALVVLTLVQKI